MSIDKYIEAVEMPPVIAWGSAVYDTKTGKELVSANPRETVRLTYRSTDGGPWKRRVRVCKLKWTRLRPHAAKVARHKAWLARGKRARVR